METNDKKRIEQRAKELDLEWEKDVFEAISFEGQLVKIAIEERTIANQQLGLLEIELRQKKTLLESCEKALEGRDQQLEDLQSIMDSGDKIWRIEYDDLEARRKEQLAEKDKHIISLKSIIDKLSESDNDVTMAKELAEKDKEIASLKEALRKCLDHLNEEEGLAGYTPFEDLKEEIENLLK